MSYSEFLLNEKFVNAFDTETKEKYKDEVYDMLQKSYASMGGLKGSGFKSPDDMVKNIPMWKIAKKNGRIVAVMLYKDKNGRKRVATGSDGSIEAKKVVREVFIQDFKRAYFEISENSLRFNARILGYDFLKQYAVKPENVKSVIGDDVEYPVPSDDKEAVSHPELKDLLYRREIGGKMHTKILLGTTGKTIVSEGTLFDD